MFEQKTFRTLNRGPMGCRYPPNPSENGVQLWLWAQYDWENRYISNTCLYMRVDWGERERGRVCVCVRLCMYTYTHLILDHIYNMYVTIYTYYRYVIHKYFYCYMVSSSLWLLSGYTHIYISIDMLYIYYIYIYTRATHQFLNICSPGIHLCTFPPGWLERPWLTCCCHHPSLRGSTRHQKMGT
jgi:hypothetical protein